MQEARAYVMSSLCGPWWCSNQCISKLWCLTASPTTTLSPNSLIDFVAFCNYEFQAAFQTRELPTNSLVDVVVFWNYAFRTVSTHTGAFYQVDLNGRIRYDING